MSKKYKVNTLLGKVKVTKNNTADPKGKFEDKDKADEYIGDNLLREFGFAANIRRNRIYASYYNDPKQYFIAKAKNLSKIVEECVPIYRQSYLRAIRYGHTVADAEKLALKAAEGAKKELLAEHDENFPDERTKDFAALLRDHSRAGN